MKKDRYLWYLYDFANSIALISVLYYFSLWAVVQNGMSQWIVSVPISLSTLVLLFVMPSIARRVDQKQTHKKVMLSFSVLASMCLLVISFLPPSTYLPYVVFILYFLFYFCYNSGYIFYTSFIQTISTEEQRIATSGLGQLWGQFGNFIGIVLSFITSGLALFGIIGTQQIFLWAALIFSLLLVPLYWFNPQYKSDAKVVTEDSSFRFATIKKIYKNKPAFWFLIAYVFYADSMITFSFFITLYLSKGVGIAAGAIKIASLLILAGSIIGGLCIALLRKRGQVNLIKKMLIVWPVLLLITAVIPNQNFLIGWMFIVGVVFSMIFAASRSLYATFVPITERAEYFSIYVIFERMGAILGPIIWSASVSIFMFLGESIAYKFAMVITSLIAFGSILVFKKIEKNTR